MIRDLNPSAKIVYRSHIEICNDVISEKGTAGHATWEYLWHFIQRADVFVSHPVDAFVPHCVDRDKLVKFGACTDLLDGLNKPLSTRDEDHYIALFNRICADQNGGRGIDVSREYIVQIARFDPSKGIPDCIQAYRILRNMLDDVVPFRQLPMLVLCGQGSIDDPDGARIYGHTMELLESEEYRDIATDVVVARVPPVDQILNAVLRRAYVALQLSHREGAFSFSLFTFVFH
jgi:glycosyltransferase involved in cell wall biosynthesis